MLRRCVCLSSVCTECIVAKRCVLEQELLLRAYSKSDMRYRLVPKWMTLTFVQRSYQGHVNHCVTFDVEYLWNRYRYMFNLVPKDHQYEVAYGLSNDHVTDDVTWSPKELEAVQYDRQLGFLSYFPSRADPGIWKGRGNFRILSLLSAPPPFLCFIFFSASSVHLPL